MSIIYIICAGLLMRYLFKFFRLPALIGMIIMGIIMGPFVIDMISKNVLDVSSYIREIALIIILIRAGISLDFSDLKSVGLNAILMSFLPASCEIFAYYIFAPMFFEITRSEALLMGSVMAAVSPAVVVPRMVELMDKKYGVKKSIPQLIMAGASCDDVFVIVLFSFFLSLNKNNTGNILSLFNIPISIVLGIFFGFAFGYVLSKIFAKIKNSYIISIIIFIVSIFFVRGEKMLSEIIHFSGLISVIVFASLSSRNLFDNIKNKISSTYNKLWIFGEIFLFVLVGTLVDISYTKEAGINAIFLIIITLIFRSFGVLLSITKTNLNKKEKLYVVISYLPKATVQAAIGGVALSAGLPVGKLILSVSVVGILFTASIGAILMDKSYKYLLEK